MKRSNYIRNIFIFLIIINCFLISQCKTIGKVIGFDVIVNAKPAVTTNLINAVTEIPFLDDFNPQKMRSLKTLQRSSKGGFILELGFYDLTVKSYCLHTGNYLPRRGDGYLYAPLEGKRAKIIQNLTLRYLDHPEISQNDVQSLIWAILARTKIADMPPRMIIIAGKLLTPEELLEVNGGAFGLIPDRLKDALLNKLPPEIRRVIEIENQIRRVLTNVNYTYEEIERIAVLVGDAPFTKDSRVVPKGRWSYHPDGYFIRYFPSGYSETYIQVFAPGPYSVKHDNLGRITNLEDNNGNNIQISYKNNDDNGNEGDETQLNVWFIKSIRFNNVEKLSSDRPVWTFVGIPSSNDNIEIIKEEFDGLQERYEWAKQHNNQMQKLFSNLNKEESYYTGINLAHLYRAINPVLDNSPEIQPIIQEIWMSQLEKILGNQHSDLNQNNTEINNTIAAPAVTSKQRLLVTTNPKEDEEEEKLVSITVESGATQNNVSGFKNWAVVNKKNHKVTVRAITDPNTMEAWLKINWNGGEAVPGRPNRRKITITESKKYSISASLGGVSDSLNVWSLWATIKIMGSGNKPDNAAPFDPGTRDNTNKLGAVTYKSLTSSVIDEEEGIFVVNMGASAKIVAQVTITPKGVNQVVKPGWDIKRDVWSRNWADGHLTSHSNTSWTDDSTNSQYLRLIPDPDDRIYDTDAPDIRWGQSTYETYNNFRQWVEWNGEKCSEYAPWSWWARWKLHRNPDKQITLNDLNVSSNRSLPD